MSRSTTPRDRSGIQNASTVPTQHAETRLLVSVCMVIFGANEWVQRSIAALAEHTPQSFELIVVDNGSTDGTRSWLREQAQQSQPFRFTLIEAEHNLGFAAGNNLAVNAARAPYVCLLNSDAIVSEGWLAPLIAALESSDNIGLAVPAFRNTDGSLQEAGSHVDGDGRVEAFSHATQVSEPALLEPRVVAFGSAACWLLRTATYRSLGGLDCGYGLAYYEDVDFAFELLRRNLLVQLVPNVEIMHAQGASAPNRETADRARAHNQTRFIGRQRALLPHRSHIYDLANEKFRLTATFGIDDPRRHLVSGTDGRVHESNNHVENLDKATVAKITDAYFQLTSITAPKELLERQRATIAGWQPQAILIESGSE